MSPLKRATLLLVILSALAKTLGLGRDVVIAWVYGASAGTDAFFLAFSLPFALYTIVGVSLTSVVIPLLADQRARGNDVLAANLSSYLVSMTALIACFISALAVLGADVIAASLGGGFQKEELRLASEFIAIMMPSVVFLSLAGVWAGLLNGRGIFGAPAFGPIAMNIIIIIGAAIGPYFLGIHGLAWATLLGSIFFLAVQYPSVCRAGFRLRPVFHLPEPLASNVKTTVWPVVLASTISYAYTVIDYRFASSLDAGSLTALSYASKLIQLPQGLFVVAISTAMFPTMTKLFSETRYQELLELVRKGFRVVFFLALVCSILFWFLGELFVSLLFERGAFDAGDSSATVSALLFYSVGLAGIFLNLPLIRVFYALGDSWTPFFVSSISLVFKGLLSYVLIEDMQHNGLALATSIALILNVILLSTLLQRKLPSLFDRPLLKLIMGMVFLSGIAVLFAYILNELLFVKLISLPMSKAGSAALKGALAVMVFAGLAMLAYGSYMMREYKGLVAIVGQRRRFVQDKR